MTAPCPRPRGRSAACRGDRALRGRRARGDARDLRHRGAAAWSAWRGACCAARTSPRRRCRTPSCGCGGRRARSTRRRARRAPGSTPSCATARSASCATRAASRPTPTAARTRRRSTENALARLPETSALRRCLEQLDAQRRAVVVLAYVHGLSHGELAGRLGVPLGTVKSWVRRSLISLQECMG